MWSIVRLCSCLLLVENAASLSTRMMQNNDVSFAEEGPIQDSVAPFSEEGPMQNNSRPASFVEESQNKSKLLNLRGAEHSDSEEEFNVFKENFLSGASETRVFTSQADALMHFLSKSNISLTRILAVGFLVVITLVSLFVVCSSAEEPSMPPTTPESMSPAKPREELTAMETCDGTWARTYQESDEQSKKGLELLFRCHIIPTVEFAHSKVSQEHIGECVWIATHMLRQRPLEEWLEVWPEAQRTFEESVTACFAARTDVRSSFYDSVHGTGSREDSPRTLEYLHAQGGDPSAQALPPQAPGSGGSAQAKPDLPPILKTPADRKSLMERCRQIMAASDAQRRPWDSKSGKSTASASRPPTDPGNVRVALPGSASSKAQGKK